MGIAFCKIIGRFGLNYYYDDDDTKLLIKKLPIYKH